MSKIYMRYRALLEGFVPEWAADEDIGGADGGTWRRIFISIGVSRVKGKLQR
ncbi:MAG: hypothetical protein ACLTLY_11250 [Agathobacter rectalis]